MTKLVKRSNFQGKRESCSRSAVTQLTKKQYFVKKKKNATKLPALKVKIIADFPAHCGQRQSFHIPPSHPTHPLFLGKTHLIEPQNESLKTFLMHN